MATRAFKPKRDDVLTNWQSVPETAPSIVKEDAMTLPRMVSMGGVLFLAVGALAMLAPAFKITYLLSPAWGFFFFLLGVVALVYHAFFETDLQFRRLYTMLGLGLFVGGVALRFWPAPVTINEQAVTQMGALFLPYGATCLGLALVFVLALVRQEETAFWKQILLRVLLIGGLAMALLGIVAGAFNSQYVQGEGIVLIALGLFYLAGYVGMKEGRGSHLAGVGIGALGLLSIGLSTWQSLRNDFFIPSGLILVLAGVVYLILSIGICSDRPVVVMTRRELAGYFYSPIAYLLIAGMLIVAWLNFMDFADNLRSGQWEPILRYFVINFLTIVNLIVIVAILTMRLLSEERRTGTLEMLLTAPINESSIVLSKFFAALIFFLLAHLPWVVFLVALRLASGTPFDYRPGLSFFFALTCTGAGFLSMGLFFSSLTKNQIIAAILTMAGMLFFTSIFWIQRSGRWSSGWNEVLTNASYLDLWLSSLEGIFAPRLLVYPILQTVFFLFLTTKVLEARKWR